MLGDIFICFSSLWNSIAKLPIPITDAKSSTGVFQSQRLQSWYTMEDFYNTIGWCGFLWVADLTAAFYTVCNTCCSHRAGSTGSLWHFLPKQLTPPEGNAPPDKSVLLPGCVGNWDQNNQQWCLKAAIAHKWHTGTLLSQIHLFSESIYLLAEDQIPAGLCCLPGGAPSAGREMEQCSVDYSSSHPLVPGRILV